MIKCVCKLQQKSLIPTYESVGVRSHDGDKKIKGRKWHALVDTNS